MSKAVEQRLKKGDGSICNNVNATDNTEISPIHVAYTVETPRGEHPSLQSKRSSPAVNRGRPTDLLRPLLYAAYHCLPSI